MKRGQLVETTSRWLTLIALGAGLALTTGISQCEQETDEDGDGWSVEDGDCNDQDPEIFPGQDEICDGVDQDCDGVIDNDAGDFYYPDADEDGYGDDNGAEQSCEPIEGYLDVGGDCDDTDPNINPDATESCDGIDEDCNGTIDDNALTLLYIDEDGDGYGDLGEEVEGCDWPSGYVEEGDDCNDADATIYPGAEEVCDGVDQNCDGSIDEGVLITYYYDYDDDGYGDPNNTTEACERPSTYVENGEDCDDQVDSTHPNALEPENGVDDDCDGTIDESIPEQVSTGSYHSLAILPNGAVWAWGSNSNGQVGDGTTVNKNAGTPVHDLSSTAIDIAAGGYHSLALLEDGTVWAWGANGNGQLGDGTTTASSLPVQVLGITNAIDIAAGEYHSLALLDDGTVWAWGANAYGQLGDGTTTSSSVPVQVQGLEGIGLVAAGWYHSLAVSAEDGTVSAWGANGYGQLGDGSNASSTTPVDVLTLSEVIDVAGGGYHSLAVLADGSVYGWGYNGVGSLGNGTTTTSYEPVLADAISGVFDVEAGLYHSLAITTEGALYSWGYNGSGQLGLGGNDTSPQYAPVQVSLTGVTAVDGGYAHSVGVVENGDFYGWGYNNYGQIGDGTNNNSTSPTQVIGLP